MVISILPAEHYIAKYNFSSLSLILVLCIVLMVITSSCIWVSRHLYYRYILLSLCFTFTFIVLGTGVIPNSEIAKDAGIEIGYANAIKVDDHVQLLEAILQTRIHIYL